MVTLRDVAADAGCSIATVSRAISGDPRIPETTRKRVLATAARIGYRPNGVARALRRRQSRMIGLLIPRLDAQNYTAGTTLLHDVLAEEGFRLVLCYHHDDEDKEAEALRSLLEYQVDGIVQIAANAGGAEAVLGRHHGVPVVELYRRTQSVDVDAVIADGELGSFELASYLIGLGHRRIAMLAGSDSKSTIKSRTAGFHKALAEAGLSAGACPVLLSGGGGIDWAREATSRLLSEDRPSAPSAIFAASTHIAIGVLEALRALAVRVPEEVSVVSFSNADWSSISGPPLTTYEVPLKEMGLMAAQMMLNRLKPEERGNLSPSVVSFAGQMVVRESAGPPPPW